MDIKPMLDMSEDIARAFGVKSVGNIVSAKIPDNTEFINFKHINDIDGVTKTAYCANLLCFVLFQGENKCVLVRQNSIRVEGGLEGWGSLLIRGIERNTKKVADAS